MYFLQWVKLLSSRWHSSHLGGFRASSWAVAVFRNCSSPRLDRHRPVKGVKPLHCMYGVSVKSTFGDDEGPAQRLKALVGQYHRHSALGVDFIGKTESQSPTSNCDWSRATPGRSKLVWAECTLWWAVRSGDSDAQRLRTNCQKADNKRWVQWKMTTLCVSRCAWKRALLAVSAESL